MNQGSPALGSPLAEQDAARFAGALGLSAADLHELLPMQVVSAGLPYLIVPVSRGLDRARIAAGDFEERLASVGAKFVYVFDPGTREGRSWDNAGAVEDVATGSAAGPAAAFLAAHGLAAPDETIVISQGRFLGRPSVIVVTPDRRGDLWVGGPVAPVARGVVDLPVSAFDEEVADVGQQQDDGGQDEQGCHGRAPVACGGPECQPDGGGHGSHGDQAGEESR